MIQKLSDEAYFALPGVSNSLLSLLSRCPAAMNIKTEQTPAMLTGSLAHKIILEGREEFYKCYAVAEPMDKRTKDGKAAWAAFCEENPGKTIITMDQLETVVGMATSISSHPACRDLLKEGQPELSITWEETIHGEVIPCKAKTDYLSATAHIDLKTCQDSSYAMFSKSIYNMKYCNQFGWYRRGLAANMAYPDHHIIIAVENKAPYTVNVYELAEEVLDFGEGQSMDLLRKYAQIKDMEVLPSYTNAGISTIQLPVWLKEIE